MQELANQQVIKDLTNTLFAIKGLGQELGKEREVITTATSQMTFSINQFQKACEQFETQLKRLNQLIEEKISKEMKALGISIAEEASRAFIISSTTQVETASQKLLHTISQGEAQLSNANGKIRFFSKWFMSIALLGALIGGLCGGGIIHYSFPKMDKQMLNQLKYGETFQDLWSKLDQKDRERLTSIRRSPLSSKKN